MERLGGRAGGVRERPSARSVTGQARRDAGGAARAAARAEPAAGRRAALEHKLDYAGRPGGHDRRSASSAARPRWRCCSASASAGFLLLLGASPLFDRRCSALAGWFAPDVWLSRAGRLRQEAIERTLPDFLDILAVSVRAGLGYRYALRRVAESLGGPVGEEMLTVLRQIDLGRTAARRSSRCASATSPTR